MGRGQGHASDLQYTIKSLLKHGRVYMTRPPPGFVSPPLASMDDSGSFFANAFADLDFIQDVKEADLALMPTQQLLFERPVNPQEAEPSRFAPPVTDEELHQRKKERISLKTRQQNVWATKVYSDWASHRNGLPETIMDVRAPVPNKEELPKCDLPTMDYWLSRFIIETRRKDGTPYPPNTLTAITSGIQRYLKEECGRLEVNLFKDDDPHFYHFRAMLDQRMKELSQKGVGSHRNRAAPVTVDDEIQLWESGTLNGDTSQGLSYAVFLYNCKVFGFRGGDEHRNLDVSQYEVTTDHRGHQKLVYFGRTAKNLQGGLKQRKIEAKAIEQHGDPSNPRCVVKLFDKYLSCIPNEGPFYRRPLSSGSLQFSEQVIGRNTLSSYMKKMYGEAKIPIGNRTIRNHSGKVTLCTNLYKENFDDQAICARSGHRSNAVRDYKRPSEKLLKDVSNSLQAPRPHKMTCTDTETLPKDAHPIHMEKKEEATPQALPGPVITETKPIPPGFLVVEIPEGVKGVILKYKGHTTKMEFD